MFNIKVFPDFCPSAQDDNNETELLNSLITTRQACGARYVNASFYDFSAPNTEAVHYLTYPIDWISHYVMNFYSDIDPLFKVDFRTIRFIDWRELYRSSDQERLLRKFTEHGLGNNAITIVDQMEHEVCCVLSATFQVEDDQWGKFKSENLEIVRFQANNIGEAYKRLFRVSRMADYKLTPRETECLYWVALGKTDDQISLLLNIGKWTVNGHLQSAKSKLGCTSRSAAVAKAITNGIIALRRAI